MKQFLVSWFGPSGFWRDDLEDNGEFLFGDIGFYIGVIIWIFWIIVIVGGFISWIKDHFKNRKSHKRIPDL